MSRPGTPPCVGSSRECGVVNGHSGGCRVDLIVEGITRGLRREGYILIEASHHAELVEELAEVTDVAKGCAKRKHQYFLDRKELLLALKRSRLALNMVPANDRRFDPASHAQIKVATDIIDAAIAKIGGIDGAFSRMGVGQ